MEIADQAGMTRIFSKLMSPVVGMIFPKLKKEKYALEAISMNITANILGLGNAATPIGLKAMNSLQTLNTKKDEATRSMITFLVLNTTGLTIIPTTIISMKMMHQSNSPTDIILPCFLASLLSTIFGLLIDKFYQRKEKNDYNF